MDNKPYILSAVEHHVVVSERITDMRAPHLPIGPNISANTTPRETRAPTRNQAGRERERGANMRKTEKVISSFSFYKVFTKGYKSIAWYREVCS